MKLVSSYDYGKKYHPFSYVYRFHFLRRLQKRGSSAEREKYRHDFKRVGKKRTGQNANKLY